LRRWSSLLLLIVAAGTVSAVDNLDLQIDRIEGAGWRAEAVALGLDLPRQAQAHATIARLFWSSQAQPMRNVRVDCLELEVSDSIIACHKAKVSASASPAGAQQLTGRLVYQRRTGALDLDLQNLQIGGGTAKVRAGLRAGGWDIRADLNRVAVAAGLQLARSFRLPLPEISASGAVSGAIQAHGAGSLQAVDMKLKITALTANNAAGSLAADKLSLVIDADAQRAASAWSWRVHVTSASGQAYAEPVFLDLGVHAIDVHARGTWTDGKQLSMDSFTIEHQQTLSVNGNARLHFAQAQPLRDLNVTVKSLQFPGAYASYLQPLLLDTNFKSLTTSGSIAGQISVVNGAPRRLDLKLDAVSLDDGARNLVLRELSGEWHWRDEAATPGRDGEVPAALPIANSHLGWTGGALLGLELGAGELQFVTLGRQFRLLEPARLPVLDGAIELESFRVRNAGQPTVAFMVDATIQPISVRRLSKAFGWPEFGGSIGGAVSKLRMREGVITLGTTLHAQVFDGEVTISDLHLEQPFGKWPRFAANVGLSNLDLELVTSAFSFGRITGRLSGAINGLQLFNWQPVAFDAALYTPPDDRSAHRISQRAVENIGSIGGGGAGITQALSSGFLRFFDDFNYDRLGITCRLENEICQMNGVAPGPNGGYYLVKGRGVPRIDVIGGARRVDWPRLVQQLIAVTESEGPVVR
jgi:hypothetical protein